MGMPFIIGASQQKKRRVLGFETYCAPDNFDRTAQPVDIYDVFERYYRTHSTAAWIYAVSNTALTTIDTYGDSYRYGYESGGVSYVIDQNTTSTISVGYSAGNRTTVTVADASAFGATGRIKVNGSYFTYTSRTGTVFTGSSQYMNAASVGDTVVEKTLYVTWVVGSTKRWVIVNQATTTTTLLYTSSYTNATWIYYGPFVSGISCNITAAIGSLLYVHGHKLNNITSYPLECLWHSGITGTLYLSSGATDISDHAFYDCKNLTSVVFAENLITVYNSAFSQCPNLAGSIVLPNSLVTLGRDTFNGDTKITNVTFGNSLQVIGNGCFYGNTGIVIDDIAFPLTLTTIGSYAFLNCTGLSGTLTITENITSIGVGSFANCNFDAIDVSANASRYHVHDYILYQESNHMAIFSIKSITSSITFESDILAIGDYCFYNNLRTMNPLVIPDAVTVLPLACFLFTPNITGTLVIHNAITAIGNSAFERSHLSGLQYETGSVIKSIGNYAFSGNIIAGMLEFPSSLLTVGTRCFQGNGGVITDVQINCATTLNIAELWFHTATGSYATLEFSTTITSFTIGGQAGFYLKFTGNLVIPASLTTWNYPQNMIDGQSTFTSITSGSTQYPASDNVLYNEKTAGQIIAVFGAKNYAGTLTLKTGTTSILGACFYQHTQRTGDIVILSTVTSIGNSAYYGCTGFTGALTINSTTVTFNVSANASGSFNGCTGLTALNLPPGYSSASLTFNFSNNFSADSLNTSIINITSGTKTVTIGATNKARLLASYPNAVTDAAARGITVV